MSYNIDRFKLKNIRLVLPKEISMRELYEKNAEQEASWIEEIQVHNDKSWDFNQDGEGLSMRGIVTDKGYQVDHISCYGEASGSDYNNLLIPLFKEYKGDLESAQVWEGGDSITRLTIVKGEVKEEGIEL